MLRILLILYAACAVHGAYVFFRSIKPLATRRVFGGTEEGTIGSWPAICALLDRAQAPLCSCAVLAPRWALTAGHCAKPEVIYVQYNGVNLNNSDVVEVDVMYQHPEYEVVTDVVNKDLDVVKLQHDVGLARTRRAMTLRGDELWLSTLSADPVAKITQFDFNSLRGQEIDVLGFGTTESNDQKPASRHLNRVRLQLQECGRDGWQHCACAVGDERGVCSGDSGGPVLYNGAQIGVTSLGPSSCGSLAIGVPQRSVFTLLQPYANIINATIDAARKEMFNDTMNDTLNDAQDKELDSTRRGRTPQLMIAVAYAGAARLAVSGVLSCIGLSLFYPIILSCVK